MTGSNLMAAVPPLVVAMDFASQLIAAAAIVSS